MREIHDTSQNGELSQAEAVAVARIARERRAREAAETLLEQKGKELYVANREMEAMLASSIKLLSDVLAMVQPDLFEKAAKVQRWARQLSSQLRIERPFELDLAALLYPIGVLSLPPVVINKYRRGEPLSYQEQKLLDESAVSAFQLVAGIPRLKGVANTLLYSRKGFDGTGVPFDGVSGSDIPQAARILKILIDFVDAATGPNKSRPDAFKQLVENRRLYDRELLKVAGVLLVQARREERQDDVFKDLSPEQLQVGDVVVSDIMDVDGHLLLASGSDLTPLSIKRLTNLRKVGRYTTGVSVRRKKSSTEEGGSSEVAHKAPIIPTKPAPKQPSLLDLVKTVN